MSIYQALKQQAKSNMRTAKSGVFKASLLLFIITLILSLLITYLSGYNRYLTNMNNIMEELSQKSELLENPTEEFINEIAQKLTNAIPELTPTAVILILLIIVMNGMLSAGFEGYCLKVVRNEEAKVLDIMRSFEYPVKALSLLVIRTFATIAGAIFLIFPGVIAYYSFSQCFMILYDHPDYSVFRCLKESAKLMKHRKTVLFTLQVSFILWYVLDNAVSMIIGIPLLSIYTTPYKGLTYAQFYEYLLITNSAAPQQ